VAKDHSSDNHLKRHGGISVSLRYTPHAGENQGAMGFEAAEVSHSDSPDQERLL